MRRHIVRRVPIAVFMTLTVWQSGMSFAQFGEGEPLGFVTVQTGQPAQRGDTGAPLPDAFGLYSDFDNGLAAGDSVITPAGSTAIVTLPQFGIVARMAPESELTINASAALDSHVNTTLSIRRGSAHVVRRTGDDRWMLVAGESAGGSGYAMTRGASLSVHIDASGVTFTAVSGDAICFAGPVPAGALVDESGKLIDKNGTALPEGHRVSTATMGQTTREDVADTLSAAMNRDLYAFGLKNSAVWVKRAEEGDFTPVRGEERGEGEFFRGTVGTEFAFDQPRSVIAAPAPRTLTPPLRQAAVVSTTQALLESGVPTSVVVGQRLRRTRIIGNPGTTGGNIRFNPSAEQLIRLPRR